MEPILACMLTGYMLANVSLDLGPGVIIAGPKPDYGQVIDGHRQTIYLECTGSMRPTFSCEDTLVFHRTSDIHLGDVIMFASEGNAGLDWIIHRIIGVEAGYYITKGDNNHVNDRELFNLTVRKQPTMIKLMGKLKGGEN